MYNSILFTIRGAGHLANDTYTDNNGSGMTTDRDSNEVDKKYRVIQNGVLETYFWQCPLETFNMINGNYQIPVPGPGGGLIQ